MSEHKKRKDTDTKQKEQGDQSKSGQDGAMRVQIGDQDGIVTADSRPKISWRDHGRKKTLIVAGGCLVIVIAVVLVVVITNRSSNGSPRAATKVSNRVATAIQSEDASTIYNQFSPDVKKTVSEKQIAAIINTPGGYKPGSLKEVPAAQTLAGGYASSANSETIQYDLQGTNNTGYKITITLFKENGIWQLGNFDKTTL
jgi:hypothetical protein